MPSGIRHLVQCRCVIPHFRKMKDPPLHMFPVFSIIEDDDTTRPKIVQCFNCGAVHRVFDVSRSEILKGKEESAAVLSREEIRSGLSEELTALLESNDCDDSVWEAVKFTIENKRWGDHVVLGSESMSGVRQGKYVRILGERLFKVESFMREEGVTING